MVSWMLFEDEGEEEEEGAIWFDTDSKYSNTYNNSMKKCVYIQNSNIAVLKVLSFNTVNKIKIICFIQTNPNDFK
jgi:hypothetical protein